MRRLLYASYFFPPLGGAGVQRALKFARYLPEHGWAPVMLTSDARYWMSDPTLLAELDPSTEIIRVPHWGSGAMQRQGGGEVRSAGRVRLLRACSRLLLLPDNYVMWSARAAVKAHALHVARPFDAVLTTSSPDSAHLLGLWLKRRVGIAWIADFRDPWTRRMAYAPPTAWHDRLQHHLEREVLFAADRVIVTSEETRRDFLEHNPTLPAGKIVVVTNGYDEHDFEAIGERVSESETSGAILHAGQLNPERPIEPYLRGLRGYLAMAGVPALPLSVFAGGHYDSDEAAVKKLGLEHHVRFVPNRPHLESVADCLRARVLLLLEQPSERGALILPGKIFEYLRAGKPILALAHPEGAAARFIRERGAGLVADPSDPAAVARALRALLVATSDSSRARTYVADSAEVRRCERRELTARLAAILDAVIEQSVAPSGFLAPTSA